MKVLTGGGMRAWEGWVAEEVQSWWRRCSQDGGKERSEEGREEVEETFVTFERISKEAEVQDEPTRAAGSDLEKLVKESRSCHVFSSRRTKISYSLKGCSCWWYFPALFAIFSMDQSQSLLQIGSIQLAPVSVLCSNKSLLWDYEPLKASCSCLFASYSPEEHWFSFCWHSRLRVCSFQLGHEQMSSSCTWYYRSFLLYAVSCCLAVSCAAKCTHTKPVWSIQHAIEITNKPKKRCLATTAWTLIMFIFVYIWVESSNLISPLHEHQDRLIKPTGVGTWSIHRLQLEQTVSSASQSRLMDGLGSCPLHVSVYQNSCWGESFENGSKM